MSQKQGEIKIVHQLLINICISTLISHDNVGFHYEDHHELYLFHNKIYFYICKLNYTNLKLF